eukprot:scaffold216901_cov28-Tisochrysis_lutea.AAC.2
MIIAPNRAVIAIERPFSVTALKTFCKSALLLTISSRWTENHNGETKRPRTDANERQASSASCASASA